MAQTTVYYYDPTTKVYTGTSGSVNSNSQPTNSTTHLPPTPSAGQEVLWTGTAWTIRTVSTSTVILPTFVPSTNSGAGTTSGTANTSAQVLPSRTNRRFLSFSNLHASATIYLNVIGGAASNTTGIPIDPGATYSYDTIVPYSQVNACSSVASVPYFVVEG